MRRTRMLMAVIVSLGFARALPPLETYRGHGLELPLPRGWTVTIDEAACTVLVAEAPNHPAGAAMRLVVVPAQPGLVAAYLAEVVLSQLAPARTELGSAYLKPARWCFGAESVPGQDLIHLQEDPADAHGAAILFLTQTGVGAPAADADLVGAAVTAFAQTLGLEATTELRRGGDGAKGTRLLSGTRLGRASTGFFAVLADGGDVRVYALAAPSERFDATGGHGLMWITLGGMSLAGFERSDEMQAWNQPAPTWGDVAWDGSCGAQQMLVDMQSRMFMAWSNNMGGNPCGGQLRELRTGAARRVRRRGA